MERQPRSGLMSLIQTHYGSIIQIKPREEGLFDLSITMSTPECEGRHPLSEREAWEVAREVQRLGGRGSVGCEFSRLSVPSNNMMAVVSNLGRILRESVKECSLCRYRVVVGIWEEDIGAAIKEGSLETGSTKNDLLSLYFGDMVSSKVEALHDESNSLASILLLPIDEISFKEILIKAETLDREHGHIPIQKQMERMELEELEGRDGGVLKLGLKDKLLIERKNLIASTLDSPYLKEFINSPSRVQSFGLSEELWKEPSSREVGYIISIRDKSRIPGLDE